MIPEVGRQTSPVAFNRTLLTSAARTASGTQVVHGFAWARDYTFTLVVSAAATATADTLNVYVQRLLPDGSTYEDIVSFTQVVGDGGAKKFVADIIPENATGAVAVPGDAALAAGSVKNVYVGDTLRIKWVIVDATTDDASFTFAVYANAR